LRRGPNEAVDPGERISAGLVSAESTHPQSSVPFADGGSTNWKVRAELREYSAVTENQVD
jgi:hypothetical protein